MNHFVFNFSLCTTRLSSPACRPNIGPDICFIGFDIQHGSGADVDIIQLTKEYLFEKENKIQIFGNDHSPTTGQVQLLPPHQGQQYNL